jgi:hypothetical protein
MSFFGNDLESQMSRALFRQDLYSRMFDDYERRQDAKSEAEFQDWKKEHDEFWENINSLIESINETSQEINNFHHTEASVALNENGRVIKVLEKLEEHQQSYNLVAKEFMECSPDQSKNFAQQKYKPVALMYFKILNTHALSLQPVTLVAQTFDEATKKFYGPIDDRITAVFENEDATNLEIDRDGWNEAWHKYDAAKVAWGAANVAIINNWDPWTETNIQSILDDYARVTGAMYRAGNEFVKHLEKAEKLLEKIWEIRKTAELTTQVQSGANQELDNFEKIEKLARLFQSGAITEEEFSAKKAELLKDIG